MYNPNRYAIAFQNLKLGTFLGVEGGREGGTGLVLSYMLDTHPTLPPLPPSLLPSFPSVDVYDFNGAHIGEVTRQERFRVPGRSSALMNATALMQPSFFEILAMGLNCLQNDNFTKLKVKGTAEARFAGKTMKQEVRVFFVSSLPPSLPPSLAWNQRMII